MRRTPAFLVLIALAAFWAGCSSSDQNRTTNANAPGTTTYGNSAPPTTGGAAPANAAPSPIGNANRSPGDTGIKPPTDK